MKREQIEYEKCSFCGGNVVDAEPSYIPIGTGSVLKVINQSCMSCGAAIIGKNQRTELIKNQEVHDKLWDFYEENLHSK